MRHLDEVDDDRSPKDSRKGSLASFLEVPEREHREGTSPDREGDARVVNLTRCGGVRHRGRRVENR